MNTTPNLHPEGEQDLTLDQVKLDGGTQIRAMTDSDTVEEYAQLMRDGHQFPPIEVVFDGTNYFLVDGFHRLLAKQRVGAVPYCQGCLPGMIRVRVMRGTRRDAILAALRANSTHGLKRSNADKARAVQIALAEFPTLSAREIARICGVAPTTVGAYRTEKPSVVTGADGRSISTVQIGQSATAPAVAAHKDGTEAAQMAKTELQSAAQTLQSEATQLEAAGQTEEAAAVRERAAVIEETISEPDTISEPEVFVAKGTEAQKEAIISAPKGDGLLTVDPLPDIGSVRIENADPRIRPLNETKDNIENLAKALLAKCRQDTTAITKLAEEVGEEATDEQVATVLAIQTYWRKLGAAIEKLG